MDIGKESVRHRTVGTKAGWRGNVMFRACEYSQASGAQSMWAGQCLEGPERWSVVRPQVPCVSLRDPHASCGSGESAEQRPVEVMHGSCGERGRLSEGPA